VTVVCISITASNISNNSSFQQLSNQLFVIVTTEASLPGTDNVIYMELEISISCHSYENYLLSIAFSDRC